MRKPRLFILIPLISFGTIGGVFFTPALPKIAEFFQISANQAQLTVTLYLITYALGQLPYGPISNRIGRKPTIGLGTTIAALGALFSALSLPFHSFGFLLFARMLHGLGAAVGLKMAFTIVADYYPPIKATRINSFMIAAFAIVPGIGALLGGYLTEMFAWSTPFYFLTAYSILLYLGSLLLPETLLEKQHDALHLKQIVHSYLLKLKNRSLILSGTIIGLMTVFTYVFASKAPFFAINILDLSPDEYGLVYLLSFSGMFLGSIFSAIISPKLQPKMAILRGLYVILLGSLSMFIFYINDIFNIYTLIIPYSLMVFGVPITYANCTTLVLSGVKNKSNAAALMSFLNIGIAFAGTQINGLINSPRPLTMAITFLTISLILFPLFLKLNKD
ncbi:MAG: MFS transporter [Simkaniaceae bacterium]